MSDEPQKGGYIRQAWLVIILALVYGAALAGTQTALGPRIAENKKNETFHQIPMLVEGADSAKTEPVTVKGKDGKDQVVYRARSADGTFLGWVLPTTGQGFADRIDVLIGVNADVTKITGMYVLDQKETPGLGALITEEDFLKQYRGISTDKPITVVKAEPAPGQILAISGATISSDSVTDIVNKTIENLKEPIRTLDTK
ncbi:MAG TPA: FMN-binding protein [Planctomycetaceae bacterium]|nr:FMN-binding protein [Planctomycetaceae bacterium]